MLGFGYAGLGYVVLAQFMLGWGICC